MRYRTLLSIFFILAVATTGSAQEKGQAGALTFQYFRIDRVKLGGNTGLKLNKDFGYLNPFDGGQRFAPDEPSSFSSLEYTFLKKPLLKKWSYEVSAGVYRNHIKGDFLLKNHTVHFGRGNSQVGLSSSLLLISPLWLKYFTTGLSVQAGIGPQFTKLTSGENAVDPKDWGIRGLGAASNLGLWLNSPPILKRLNLNAGLVYNLTWSRYGGFSVTNKNNGEKQTYKGIYFFTGSHRPSFTVSVKYTLFR